MAAHGTAYDYGNGYASIQLSFASEANTTYTAVGTHRANIYLWDYDDYYSYETFYFDTWFFSNFESSNIYEPWDYYFTSPGYNYYYHRRIQNINLGKTFDSVLTTGDTPLAIIVIYS